MSTYINPDVIRKLTPILNAVMREWDMQNFKWGDGTTANSHDLAGWLLILQNELAEALQAWVKFPGTDEARKEVLQVLTVCFAALMEHGVVERDNFKQIYNQFDIRHRGNEAYSEARTEARRRYHGYRRAKYKDGIWTGRGIPEFPTNLASPNYIPIPEVPVGVGEFGKSVEFLGSSTSRLSNIAKEMAGSFLSGAMKEAKKQASPPRVIFVIGSNSYGVDVYNFTEEQSAQGNIVLLTGVYTRGAYFTRLSEGEQAEALKRLDEANRHKIKMANEVMVINPEGYIGDYTRSLIQYAENEASTPVRYMTDVVKFKNRQYWVQQSNLVYDGTTPIRYEQPRAVVYKGGKRVKLLTQTEAESLPNHTKIKVMLRLRMNEGPKDFTTLWRDDGKLWLCSGGHPVRGLYRVGDRVGENNLVWIEEEPVGISVEYSPTYAHFIREKAQAASGKVVSTNLISNYESLRLLPIGTLVSVIIPPTKGSPIPLSLDVAQVVAHKEKGVLLETPERHRLLLEPGDSFSMQVLSAAVRWERGKMKFGRSPYQFFMNEPNLPTTPLTEMRDGYQVQRFGTRAYVLDGGQKCLILNKEELMELGENTPITIRWRATTQFNAPLPVVGTYLLRVGQMGERLWAEAANRELIPIELEAVGDGPFDVNIWQSGVMRPFVIDENKSYYLLNAKELNRLPNGVKIRLRSPGSTPIDVVIRRVGEGFQLYDDNSQFIGMILPDQIGYRVNDVQVWLPK